PPRHTTAPATTPLDTAAPPPPLHHARPRAQLSGTADPGATVTLTDGIGNQIGQVTADGSCNLSFTPSKPLSNFTLLNSNATAQAVIHGCHVSSFLSSFSPATPTVNLSNGSSLS
ncbi:hypothetical protein J5N91_00205, partial [Pseudomonas aeruginosa]|nr:hypothetical protein [Pseudomonas aeruginosa]